MSDPWVVSWRVPPALPALKLAGAAAFGLLAVVFGDDATRLWPTLAAAAGLAGWAARDLIAPVRVAAGPAGVQVISGYAGRRTLDWAEIERIGVDVRPRLGLRTETLEIDAGQTLHLFGRYDLDAPLTEVAARLRALAGPAGSAGDDPGDGQQHQHQ